MLIKSIQKTRFRIELRQVENDYIIMLEDDNGPMYSSPIQDLKLASFMFDLWLQQVEGF